MSYDDGYFALLVHFLGASFPFLLGIDERHWATWNVAVMNSLLLLVASISTLL